MTVTNDDAVRRGQGPAHHHRPVVGRGGSSQHGLKPRGTSRSQLQRGQIQLPSVRLGAAPPAWANFPDTMDLMSERADTEDVGAARRTSRWFTSLCAARKVVEVKRLKRRHLRPLGASATRDLPLVIKSHDFAGAAS